MAADGHIVDIKGLFINILGKGAFKHFKVTLRPSAGYVLLHTVAHTHKAFGIAQIIMSSVTVIISIRVIMVSLAEISETV